MHASKRRPAVGGIVLAFLTFGAATIGGTPASGWASPDMCIMEETIRTALEGDNRSAVDCGLPARTTVDAHGGNVGTAGVEDWDGTQGEWTGSTQGEVCGANAPFTVPRC